MFWSSFIPRGVHGQVVAPLVTHQRALIPGAPPQLLWSRAIGRGPPIPLLAFASLPASGGSPVLTVLDASKGAGVGAGVAIEQIQLPMRCCPNSIVSGNLHSVWVSPFEVNSFVPRGIEGVHSGNGRVEAEVGGDGEWRGRQARFAAALRARTVFVYAHSVPFLFERGPVRSNLILPIQFDRRDRALYSCARFRPRQSYRTPLCGSDAVKRRRRVN